MSRPKKWRTVCCLPQFNKFGPLGANTSESVILSVDEYETIRLIDYEGLKQEECANQMNVARTTVQGIYDTARKKVADALVNGKLITVKGGNYMLCDQRGEHCSRISGACRRRGNGHRHKIDKEN